MRDHENLAKHMNTIVFHTKMVDYLDEMIIETSDLSLYWYVDISHEFSLIMRRNKILCWKLLNKFFPLFITASTHLFLSSSLSSVWSFQLNIATVLLFLCYVLILCRPLMSFVLKRLVLDSFFIFNY